MSNFDYKFIPVDENGKVIMHFDDFNQFVKQVYNNGIKAGEEQATKKVDKTDVTRAYERGYSDGYSAGYRHGSGVYYTTTTIAPTVPTVPTSISNDSVTATTSTPSINVKVSTVTPEDNNTAEAAASSTEEKSRLTENAATNWSETAATFDTAVDRLFSLFEEWNNALEEDKIDNATT